VTIEAPTVGVPEVAGRLLDQANLARATGLMFLTEPSRAVPPAEAAAKPPPRRGRLDSVKKNCDKWDRIMGSDLRNWISESDLG
jgi:hypothetical protein